MIYLSTKDGLQALIHRAVLHNGTLIYASLVGSREEVHAVRGALAQSHWVWLWGEGSRVRVSPPWQGLKFRQARLARGVLHGVLESFYEEYFWGRKEQKAEWLAGRLKLPILPEWVGFLESLPRVREAQERLWAYGTAALHLPDFRVDEVRQAVQEALQRGELPLPEEVLRWSN